MNVIEQEKACQLLLKRFKHLLKSETIGEFDEVETKTGKYRKDIESFDGYVNGLKSTVNELIKENVRLEQELKQLNNGWIPISLEETYPKPFEPVQFTDGEYNYLGYCDPHYEWSSTNGEDTINIDFVVAWQHLPKPYEVPHDN